MANIARVPITNVHMGGDYTGRILVGPGKQPMNVILDTGSSALALDGTKYTPRLSDGDQSTDLAQTDSYGDGKRLGPVRSSRRRFRSETERHPSSYPAVMPPSRTRRPLTCSREPMEF